MKKRFIAKILMKDGVVVQSINFKKYLPVGSVENTLEYFNNWQADEIILVDISKKVNLNNNIDLISKISKRNRIPLCYGGGIESINDVISLIRLGVEKVSVNSSSINNKKLLKQISNLYGSQCLIISLDIKKIKNEFFIFDHKKKEYLVLNKKKIQEYEDSGIGEFFIQCMDNDGAKKGFNISLLKKIIKLTNKPIIFSSGFGKFNHLKKICNTEVSAISVGNSLHFKEMSILNLKINVNKFFKKEVFRVEKNYHI